MLRKKGAWVGMVLLGLSGIVDGLDAQAVDIPDFNTMASPPGPAWTLLDIEPSAVERPSNATAFGLSLLQQTDNLSTLPSDWAIDLTPYWLVSGSELQWEDDLERDLLESIQRTTSLSFATAQTGDDARPVTSVAAAFRLSVLSGRVPEATRQEASRLRTLLTRMARTEEERAEEYRQAMHVEDSLAVRMGRDGQANALAWLGAKQDSIQAMVLEDLGRVDLASQSKAATEFQLNASVRHGFMLEVAGGWSADVALNVADSLQTRQLGIWVSPSWVGPEGSIVGVVRYLSDPGVDVPEFDGALDFGVRGSLQQPRFAVSLEGAMRTFRLAEGVSAAGAPQQGDWRLAGIIEYRLQTSLWVRATFGRDFDRVAEGGGLLAQIAISFDLGTERYDQD